MSPVHFSGVLLDFTVTIHVGMPRMKRGRGIGMGFIAGGSLKAPESILGQFTDL